MMVNWKFAWREARQRPSRAILTLLSIVIGVAAVVAVTIASGTTRQAFNQIYQTVAGKASLVISGAIGSSFDENIAEQVRKVPGVTAVAPLLKRNTILYLGTTPQPAPAKDNTAKEGNAAKVGNVATTDNTTRRSKKQFRLVAL